MPCESSEEDRRDAELVADTFGVRKIEIDLKETFQVMKNSIEKEVGVVLEEAKINCKPRIRMTTLYMIAQSLQYLVIGTGNLCERMVGYTTKWGDSACDFNPIGNFTVEEVLKIGKYLGVPDKILNKSPNDGLGGMADEEKMGITYKQITEYIQTGETEEKAKEIIKCKWMSSIHKRIAVPMYPVERKNYLEN